MSSSSASKTGPQSSSSPKLSTKNQLVLDQIKALSESIQTAKQHRGRGRGRPFVQRLGLRGNPRLFKTPYPTTKPSTLLSKNQTLVNKPNSVVANETNAHSSHPSMTVSAAVLEGKTQSKHESYVSRGNTLTRVGAVIPKPPPIPQPLPVKEKKHKRVPPLQPSSKNRTLFIKDGITYSKKGNTVTALSVLASQKEQKKKKWEAKVKESWNAFKKRMPQKITIEGIDFVLKGRKLKRIGYSETGSKKASNLLKTPKAVIAGGRTFKRSKKGNLVLSNKTTSKEKTKRPLNRKQNKTLDLTKIRAKKAKKNCQFYRYGKCEKKDCPYLHDPRRLALCPKYMMSTCSDLDCKLSHAPSEYTTPLCAFFQKGQCTRSHCKFSHIKHGAVPVCSAFAEEGYCEKGFNCLFRHVFLCPRFDSTGTCDQPRCRLPHVSKQDRKGKGRLNEKQESRATKKEESVSENEGMLPIIPDFEDLENEQYLGEDLQRDEETFGTEEEVSEEDSSLSGSEEEEEEEGDEEEEEESENEDETVIELCIPSDLSEEEESDWDTSAPKLNQSATDDFIGFF